MTKKTNIYVLLVLVLMFFIGSCSENAGNPGVVLLYTPANFRIALVDYSSVELSWDEVEGAKYKVYYGTESMFYNGVSAYQGRSPVETSDTSIILEGLEVGTTYYLVVTAFDNLRETDPTIEVYIAPQASPTPPEAPTGFLATAQDSSSIELTWNDNSFNERGYLLYRSLQETQGFDEIDNITAPAESYIDSYGLNELTTYYYKILAYNNSGSSNFSNTSSTTTPEAPAEPPSAPSNLRVTAHSYNFIKIVWNDNSSNEDKFEIFRSEVLGSCSAFTYLNEVAPGIKVYQDGSLTAEKIYYYCVRASNTAGPSLFAGPVSETTDSEPLTAPNTPSGLNATKAGESKIDLSWIDNADNESGYIIQRSLSQSSGYQEDGRIEQPIASNPATYQSQGLNPSTLYWFRVIAYNGAGNSSPSASASATTGPAIPTAPELTSATAAGSDSVDLQWNDKSTTEAGFKILRSMDDINYSEVGLAVIDDTSHTDSNGLSSSTNYWYQIEAYNESGSTFSNRLSVVTDAPGAPSGFTADGSIDFESILVSWDNVQGATGYTLYYSGSSNVDENSASVYTTSNSYTYTGWDICGTRIYFRVRVEDPTPSALSNTISAVTKPCQIYAEMLLALTPSLNQITAWFVPWDDELPTSYKIEYTDIDTGNTDIETIDAPSDIGTWDGHPLGGLTNGNRYYVNVTSINESGEGPVSDDKVAQPGKPAPKSLQKSTVSGCDGKFGGKMAVPAFVDLYWSPPDTGESISGYHVNILDLSNGDQWYENFDFSSPKNQAVSKNSWVTVYITAIYADGDSASSNVLRFCPCGNCP